MGENKTCRGKTEEGEQTRTSVEKWGKEQGGRGRGERDLQMERGGGEWGGCPVPKMKAKDVRSAGTSEGAGICAEKAARWDS